MTPSTTRTSIAGALLLALAAASLGCGKGTPKGGALTLRGHYMSGFEASEFQECGSDESWWIDDPSGELYDQYDALMLEDYEPAYVVLHATVSEKGEYGHLGAYPREVTVQEVFDLRVSADDDCD